MLLEDFRVDGEKFAMVGDENDGDALSKESFNGFLGGVLREVGIVGVDDCFVASEVFHKRNGG